MTRIVRAFRRAALPLISYYAITLALPVANGAARADAFLDHALVVLVVPPVAVLLTCAAGWSTRVVANLTFLGNSSRKATRLRASTPHSHQQQRPASLTTRSPASQRS